MSANENFRDKLLKQDELAKQDAAGYRQAIQQEFEKKLGPVTRTGYGVIALIGLLTVAFFINLGWFTKIGSEMMLLAIQLIAFIAIILFGTLTFITGRAAWTGRSLHFNMAFIFGGCVLLFLYYLVTLLYFIYIAPITLEDPLHPNAMLAGQIMTILFFAMVLLGLLLILRSVVKSHFETRRKLLEIEYKLCTALEQLEKRNARQ